MSDKNSDPSWKDSYQKEKPKISIKRAKEAEFKSANIGEPSEISLPTPEKVESKIEKIEVENKEKVEQPQEVSKPATEIKISKAKDFPLEKIKENLKPEIKEIIKKIDSKVSKEEIKELVVAMEKNKDIIFEDTGANVFSGLSLSDSSTLSKKMDEWNVPKEAGDLNASVILAWLNKNKK